mmetsp:Transcript_43585/g.69656  ORF Transcript_43585/g.69656 Transcript_43585/m.69656 type:complete len:354 (-) Transcript_43585:192-1253(-)
MCLQLQTDNATLTTASYSVKLFLCISSRASATTSDGNSALSKEPPMIKVGGASGTKVFRPCDLVSMSKTSALSETLLSISLPSAYQSPTVFCLSLAELRKAEASGWQPSSTSSSLLMTALPSSSHHVLKLDFLPASALKSSSAFGGCGVLLESWSADAANGGLCRTLAMVSLLSLLSTTTDRRGASSRCKASSNKRLASPSSEAKLEGNSAKVTLVFFRGAGGSLERAASDAEKLDLTESPKLLLLVFFRQGFLQTAGGSASGVESALLRWEFLNALCFKALGALDLPGELLLVLRVDSALAREPNSAFSKDALLESLLRKVLTSSVSVASAALLWAFSCIRARVLSISLCFI